MAQYKNDELERIFNDFGSMMEELKRSGSLPVFQFERLQRTTKMTADTLDGKFNRAVKAAEVKLEQFSKSGLGKTTKAIGGLAKSAGDTAFAARKNRESFESLNPVIDAAAAALSAIPIFGDAAAKATAAVGKFATAELDESVKAFQTIGSVGAIAGEGVTGLRTAAERTGLSFQQLSSVVSNTSGSLAFAFGGTASGLQEIAKITQAAQPFRSELLKLGFSFQEQSEVFAESIERDARLGRIQGRSTADLAQSSAQYAKNLADLSRLTGLSTDAAQSELDAQMSNIRFRKAISGIDKDVADSISNVGVVIAGLGKDPELTRGFQDLVAGFGTEAATNFTIATGGVGKEVADLLKAGAITEQEAMSRLQTAFQATYEKLPAQVLGVGTAFDATALGMANIATAQIDYNKALEQGKAVVGAQDSATDAMVNAQESLQRLATEVDTFVNNNVFPHATDVVESLTGSLADLAGMINSVTGSTRTVPQRQMGGPVLGGQPYMVGEAGPELVVPKSSGTVIPSDQLVALFEQTSKMQGGSSLVEGMKRTFLPGIGYATSYNAGGMGNAKITDFAGNILGEQTNVNDLSTNTQFRETLSGPRDSYASSVLGTDAISSISSSGFYGSGADKITATSQGAMTQETAEALIAELRTIAQNTRTGADASKKLVRAQS